MGQAEGAMAGKEGERRRNKYIVSARKEEKKAGGIGGLR
jgi:hypothetical protein